MTTVLGRLALLVFFAGPVAKPQATTADSEMTAGGLAREKGDYPTALQHFQRAVDLDSQRVDTNFALALIADDLCTSYNADMSDPHCKLALQQYRKVLELDNSNEVAAKNLAFVLYHLNLPDESEKYYRTALALDSDDGEAMCAVAASDWRRSYRLFAESGMSLDAAASIDAPSCTTVRDNVQSRLNEGMALLGRALRGRNKNVDLLDWSSAFCWLRAHVRCDDQTAYRADMNTAKELFQKARRAQARRHRVFYRCPPAPAPPPRFK